jgi:hypothetical protein
VRASLLKFSSSRLQIELARRIRAADLTYGTRT